MVLKGITDLWNVKRKILMLNILFGLEIGSNDKIQAPRSEIDLTTIQNLH